MTREKEFCMPKLKTSMYSYITHKCTVVDVTFVCCTPACTSVHLYLYVYTFVCCITDSMLTLYLSNHRLDGCSVNIKFI